MHWRRLIEGSRLYREKEPLDQLYFSFEELPDCTDEAVARRLIDFINSWSTRTPMTPIQLRNACTSQSALLNALSERTIETLDLDSELHNGYSVCAAITEVFDAIANCGPRRESTGASKILHALLPQLFVMWDLGIAGGYGLGGSQPRRDGHDYAFTFLRRVMNEMEEAIATYADEFDCERRDAIRGLVARGGDRTLAKLLDEYNFAKYTLSVDELWVKAS